MIEFLDNALQLGVLGSCVALSLINFLRCHSDEWLMVFGFFGCCFLGLTYWTFYLLAFGETPSYFYVSDLAWAAGYLFLFMLVASLDERRRPSPPVPAAWLAIVVMVPLFVLYSLYGDVLLNFVDCAIMGAIGFFAARGLAATSFDGPEGSRPLHLCVLTWWLAQLAVWTTSCFCGAESLTPYIVSDVAVTVMYLVILITMRRTLA